MTSIFFGESIGESSNQINQNRLNCKYSWTEIPRRFAAEGNRFHFRTQRTNALDDFGCWMDHATLRSKMFSGCFLTERVRPKKDVQASFRRKNALQGPASILTEKLVNLGRGIGYSSIHYVLNKLEGIMTAFK